jgi:hypothetical protein
MELQSLSVERAVESLAALCRYNWRTLPQLELRGLAVNSKIAALLILPFFSPILVFAEDRTPPKTLDSSPCTTPPQIDGVVDAQEWKDAKLHPFDIPFLRIDPAMTEKRSLEVRVMNSANGLYVALTAPDATIDDSLSPIQLDSAMLAFNRGPKLAPLSDRKAIAKGLYRDKHLNADGKGDADDAQQDGLGAMARKDGKVTFEWAIKLDSGDKHDLQIKPGESVRFNLAYFDALQLPLTKTIMGGLYGPAMDKAEAWGELKLAKDVKDDGGAAFDGPRWAGDVAKALDGIAPGRFKVTGTAMVPGSQPAAVSASLDFTYSDPQGKATEGKARVYFPAQFKAEGKTRLPLLFYAGYELNDGGALAFLNRGWIVVTPAALPANPLIRHINPDVALLHFARRMPWIDDSRVMITGGSAGGWMTLMLTAETFPLAGAAPDVPPVNWGYNAKYFFTQLDKSGAAAGQTSARIPTLFMVSTMLKPSVEVHGGDFNDETWFASSPVAHVSTITCPVSVFWSTADVLVPIDQVGKQWVRGLESGKFPVGFSMEIEKLMQSEMGRRTLIEALPKEDYEIYMVEVPKGTRLQGGAEGTGKVVLHDLAFNKDKRWSLTIIEEGQASPEVGHQKYAVVPSRNAYFEHILKSPIAVHQLTLPKLERLIHRYTGKEWLPSRLKHLDELEAERSDVMRGIATYISTSPEHARTFRELYGKLPREKQVLPIDRLGSP